MRLRHLVFLPIAAMIGFLVLASASSLVLALEGSVVSAFEGSVHAETMAIRVSRYETVCDRLFREAHALSHEVTSCEARVACAGSPLLCPVAQDQQVEREYARLRTELHAECGVPLDLMDYAWGGPAGEGPACGYAHDWLEAASSGAAEPTRFVF